MVTHEFKDAIFYRVACDCGDERCDLTLTLELDEHGIIFLNIYKKLRASSYWGNYWNHFDFIRVFWNKIKMTFKIWTQGYIEVEESTVFQNEDHIENFIKALEEGIVYLQNAHSKNNKNNNIET
jgi:hypothetical protein